jgi:hypothetical protein
MLRNINEHCIWGGGGDINKNVENENFWKIDGKITNEQAL